MKRVAVAAAVLAWAICGCGDRAPSDVLLRTPGYTSAYASARPDLAFPFGAVVLQNDGSEPLTLRDVRLESDSGVRLLSAKVLGPGRRDFMTAGGVHWPGGGITGLKPLRGYVVRAHSNVEPYLKLRAPAGRHILQGIIVDYSIGGSDHSVERALRFAVCVREPINRRCKVPRARELD